MGLAARHPDNETYARQMIAYLPFATHRQALRAYQYMMDDPRLDPWVMAQVALFDRFFLLTCLLKRTDASHPWLYERCRELERTPDGCIDLWARNHYKSSLITFAGAIQEMAKDSAMYQDLAPPDAAWRGPGKEITIGIFSHNRPTAKAFLRQIMVECEQNPVLPYCWPDVFWKNPKREAPSWSLDAGLILQRRSNPKEATVEGWGLVDGQPTGKHFKLMIYDDVVTRESVTTPEMILKTTEAWELSRNLSSAYDHTGHTRTWMIGTRYNYADTYQTIMERQVATPRIYPATADGTPDGAPVFLQPDAWAAKKREMSAYVLSCQMLQNPLAGTANEFKLEWLRRYELRPLTLNVGICVDPAHSRKKDSCDTAFAVIGIDAARNKYLLDGACHKMNLTQRWTMLKRLRNKWVNARGVQIVRIGYERYGLQADIEHFEEMMRIEKSHFPIMEVSWTRDGTDSKDDRIRRLVPDHQNWRFFYPYEGDETGAQMRAKAADKGFLVAQPIKQINEDGRVYNVVEKMKHNEYVYFPATTHKDFLDAMSRFYDLDLPPPTVFDERDLYPEPED